MAFIRRNLENQVIKAARAFGALVLTGPRRSGKTSLLRQLFPNAGYYLFEDPDIVGRFRADPQGFLDSIKPPVILDEIQNVPELFNFIRSRVDRFPQRKGQWLLTASQESGLMRNVSESMAGRAAVLQLLPLALSETPKVSLLKGGYPEVLQRPRNASLWFASYLQTYLERDVRSISAVQDLSKFRRFMALLATRHASVLNKTDLAAPLGMSVPGITNWLDILEATGLVMLVPSYFENFGKRLIKSPKLYWVDSGLVCHLLNIESEAALERSPFLGALFEGWVAAEVAKSQVNAGRRRELYYFRDQQGLEVDFIMPAPASKTRAAGMWMLEAKASRSPSADMARPILALAKSWPTGLNAQPLAGSWLVHRPARHHVDSTALAAGVKAITIEQLSKQLS